MVGELPVVADLITAGQSRDAVGKEYALGGKRVGARAETAAAVADVAANIKSGPVIDRFESRRLERQVGGARGAGQHQHAETHARDDALPKWAAAAHRGAASSANIRRSLTSLLTIMTARCAQ
jgi:hypothetical protein